MNKLSKLSTQEQMAKVVAQVKDETGWNDGRLIDEFVDFYRNYEFSERLYEPDATLCQRLIDYESWGNGIAVENAGHLMEEIAFLAFRCLKGIEVIKSYQSFAAQHDLVVSGSSSQWHMLMKFLQIDSSSRTIVIEAKNEAEPITDAQFSRLCSIIQNKFSTCRLGVFVSRQSASGFPERNDKGVVRQRNLANARATQILFRATSNKFVVVLDHHDIMQLSKSGSLPRLLEAKIRDVDEVSGIPLEFEENSWKEMDLPPHLAKYLA